VGQGKKLRGKNKGEKRIKYLKDYENKKIREDYSEEAIYKLLGRVIKQAITDANRKAKTPDKQDAMEFLFDGVRLEEFIEIWRVDLSADYIRREAKKILNVSNE